MHRSIFFSLLITLFIGAGWLALIKQSSKDHQNNINTILQNEGIAHLGGFDDSVPERKKIKAHLSYVHELLSRANHREQSEAWKAKRKKGLHHLMEYIQAEAFPVNTKYKGRRPCFVDEHNNYCAVAYLLKTAGQNDLVQAINRQFQYGYVLDMDDANFLNWVAQSGFTLRELAMIQPAYDFRRLRKGHQLSAQSLQRETSEAYVSAGYNWFKSQNLNGRFVKQWQRNIGLSYEHYYNSDFGIALNYDRTFFSFEPVRRVPFLAQFGFRPRYFNFDEGAGLNLEPYIKGMFGIDTRYRFSANLFASYGYDIPVVGDANFPLSRKLLSLGLSIGFNK